MVVAFGGWPDAAEAATGAVKYLAAGLGATKFAEIDPEDFYNFTEVRPTTHLNDKEDRVVAWPANEFYFVEPNEQSHGMVLFAGIEPSLKWKRFCQLMSEVAQKCGIKVIITLGALLDAVPHTRDPEVTGRATAPDLARKVEWIGVSDSAYEGPAGITTALMEVLVAQGLQYASLWGHSPHYIDTTPNAKVSQALLERLRNLVAFDIDMTDLGAQAQDFESRVSQSLVDQADIASYVQRLEQKYDAAHTPSTEIPASKDMVAELEQFLRSQRPASESPDSL